MVDQRSFFSSYFSFLYGRRLVLYLLLIYYIDLVRLTVILFGRYNWQMVATKKIHNALPCFCGLSHLG